MIEPEASIAYLFSKDAILLDQICNDLLLVLAHPAGNRRYEKRKWVQRCTHRPILWTQIRGRSQHNHLNEIEFLNTTTSAMDYAVWALVR
jgi:hypothetical protein